MHAITPHTTIAGNTSNATRHRLNIIPPLNQTSNNPLMTLLFEFGRAALDTHAENQTY